MQVALLTMAGAILVTGLAFLLHVVKKEKERENGYTGSRPPARIEARLEYDQTNGGVFYVIENMGHMIAHDVRVYLPRCQEIAASRRGINSLTIANSMTKAMLQTYSAIGPQEKVEIPILQLPPVEESSRDIYGLGLDVEIRWSNIHGDMVAIEHILPASSRISEKRPLPAYA